MTKKNKRALTRNLALELGFKEDKHDFLYFACFFLFWRTNGQAVIVSRVGGLESEEVRTVGDVLDYVDREPVSEAALLLLGWEKDRARYMKNGIVVHFFNANFLLENGAGFLPIVDTLGQLYSNFEDSRILPYQTQLEKTLRFL